VQIPARTAQPTGDLPGFPGKLTQILAEALALHVARTVNYVPADGRSYWRSTGTRSAADLWYGEDLAEDAPRYESVVVDEKAEDEADPEHENAE
jgi:hypothetical protein